MFTLTRTLLCLAVSLTLACACAAQTRSKLKSGTQGAKPRHAPKAEKERVIIAESVSEPAEVRQVGQVQVRYYHGPGENVMGVGRPARCLPLAGADDRL